jgi:hypothetical protein
MVKRPSSAGFRGRSPQPVTRGGFRRGGVACAPCDGSPPRPPRVSARWLPIAHLSLAKTPSTLEGLTFSPRARIFPGSMLRLLVDLLPAIRSATSGHPAQRAPPAPADRVFCRLLRRRANASRGRQGLTVRASCRAASRRDIQRRQPPPGRRPASPLRLAPGGVDRFGPDVSLDHAAASIGGWWSSARGPKASSSHAAGTTSGAPLPGGRRPASSRFARRLVHGSCFGDRQAPSPPWSSTGPGR